MKKTIRCTAKNGVSEKIHEDLQCFASIWGIDLRYIDSKQQTILTASEDEIDGLLMNESWVRGNFDITEC